VQSQFGSSPSSPVYVSRARARYAVLTDTCLPAASHSHSASDTETQSLAVEHVVHSAGTAAQLCEMHRCAVGALASQATSSPETAGSVELGAGAALAEGAGALELGPQAASARSAIENGFVFIWSEDARAPAPSRVFFSGRRDREVRTI
jgi:hypothetical protein